MEEDEKREASDNFNSKSNCVTQHQLSKFQELQRRRLKLISKSKKEKPKAKGAKIKLPQHEALGTKGILDDNSKQGIKDASISSSSSQGNEMSSSSLQVDVHPVFQKKKLYWGLDSKERWERKANM